MFEEDLSNICVYCSANQAELLLTIPAGTGKQYSFFACKSCKCVFLNPLPSEEDLMKEYNNLYYGTSPTKFIKGAQQIFNLFSLFTVGKVSQLLSPPASVLDIGCGDGRLLAALAKRGYNCFGTEVGDIPLERAGSREGVKVFYGELSQQRFASSSFDIITMIHVFEHLRHAKQDLQIIADIVKPEGFLLLSFPNINSFQARLFKEKWFHLDPPRHLFFPDHQTLVRDLADLNFQLVNFHTWDLMQGTFGILESALNRFFPSSEDTLYDRLKGSSPLKIWDIMSGALFLPASLIFFLFESSLGRGGCLNYVFQKTERVKGV